jgi:hypothetical protein
MSSPLKVRKPTELRENLFDTLEQTAQGEAFLIHHKSGNAILQGEAEYLALLEQVETLEAINQGLQDYLDGKVHSHANMKDSMKAYAKKWKK